MTTATEKTYTVTLTAQQLATLKVAVASEMEHAHDAARDMDGDEREVARYEAIEARNLEVWRLLDDLTTR
jgi:hypothetical protein